MDLAEVADELYGLPPPDFVPQRSLRARQARADGDRDLAAQVAALRKPTAAAWAVNQLVRHKGTEVAALLDLGEQLRVAQATLAGEDLRRLGAQRRQVVAALARQARGVAADLGHPISEATEEEVAQTLLAALADPAAGEAVSSGRLTTVLSYSGVGPVEGDAVTAAVAIRPALRVVPGGKGTTRAAGVRGATRGGEAYGEAYGVADGEADGEAERRARESAEAAEAAKAERRRELARARQRLDEAEAQARQEEEAAQAAARASRDAASAHDEAQARVRELAAALEAAREQVGRSRQAAQRAERARVEAKRRAARARGAVETAQRVVGRLG